MALLMVGFLLGGKLTAGALSKSAGQILWISISAAIVTTLIVSSCLVWIGIAVVKSINGLGADVLPILTVIREIGGAILLGVLIGLPAAYLTGRIKSGQPMLIRWPSSV